MTRQELIVKAIRKTFVLAAAYKGAGDSFDVNQVQGLTVKTWFTDSQGQREIIRVCLSYLVDHKDGCGPRDKLFPQLYQVEKLEQDG